MKKPYKYALCLRNDFGYERVIFPGKVYEVISRTNRYVTVKTEFGVQGIWKGYFKLFVDEISLECYNEKRKHLGG